MAERLVVCDASTLIGLASADAFELLEQLFGKIVVTTVVRDEVLTGGDRSGAHELSCAIGNGWAKVVRVEPIATLPAKLDVGEASTLALAIRHGGATVVLMDEKAGRSVARALGLEVIGLVGLLLEARREGMITSIRPRLERFRTQGFRLSESLFHWILKEDGEP